MVPSPFGHSEYVAGRLLTLVVEGKLSADELALYSSSIKARYGLNVVSPEDALASV